MKASRDAGYMGSDGIDWSQCISVKNMSHIAHVAILNFAEIYHSGNLVN